MAHLIDGTKTGIQNLLTLINTNNAATGLALTPAMVTFGNPVVRTPDANPDNTSITVTPVPGGGLSGDPVEITYNRLWVGGAKADRIDHIDVDATTTIEQFHAAVAVAWNLPPDQFTISGPLPTETGTNGMSIDVDPAISLVFYNGDSIDARFP